MAYSVEADLEVAAGGRDRLSGLSDHDRDGNPDTAVIDTAIAKADSWIDLYVQRRHATPLQAPLPDIIVRMSADEAVYILRRAKDQLTDQDIAEHIERRDELEGISSGALALAVDPNPGKSSAVSGARGDREDRVAGSTTRDDLGGLW